MLLKSMIKLLLKKPSKHILQLFDDKIGFKRPSTVEVWAEQCGRTERSVYHYLLGPFYYIQTHFLFFFAHDCNIMESHSYNLSSFSSGPWKFQTCLNCNPLSNLFRYLNGSHDTKMNIGQVIRTILWLAIHHLLREDNYIYFIFFDL